MEEFRRRFTKNAEEFDAIIVDLFQYVEGIKAQVEEETVGKYAKDIATEFFYYWYNSPGTNTEQGFDEWWEINRDRLTPRKYKEQSNED